MNEFHLKFRIWNKKTKSWMTNKQIWRLSPDNHDSIYFEFYNPLFYDKTEFIINQYICFKDLTGKEIYEGDIIKFKYPLDGFAEDSKEYIGTIERKVTSPVNFRIKVRNQYEMSLPLQYAKASIVIGNIYEN